jgi:hypothetical protein
MHDVKFNELTESTELMNVDGLGMCIDNLREIIQDEKAQWNKLASILQVDGDNVDAVFAAARIAMAGIGNNTSQANIEAALGAFPAFAEIHKHIDAACLYELDRLNRHINALTEVSVDEFIAIKARNGDFKLNPIPFLQKEPSFGRRSIDAIAKWLKRGSK